MQPYARMPAPCAAPVFHHVRSCGGRDPRGARCEHVLMDYAALPDHSRPLVEALRMDRVAAGRFRSEATEGAARRRYGGETAALALRAACLTIEEHVTKEGDEGGGRGEAPGGARSPLPAPHHAHAVFLAPADSSAALDLQVSVLRRGRTHSTCRTDVFQADRLVLSLTATFAPLRPGGAGDPGDLAFQRPMETVTPPADLPDPAEAYAHLEGIPAWLARYTVAKPLEVRFPSDPIRVDIARGGTRRHHQQAWIRSDAPVPDSAEARASGLLYLSDALILSTALGPHGLHLTSEGMRFGTLDHTMWFHEDADPHEWLLCDMQAEWTGHERGYCTGAFYREDGSRVASFTQQGMLRLRQ